MKAAGTILPMTLTGGSFTGTINKFNAYCVIDGGTNYLWGVANVNVSTSGTSITLTNSLGTWLASSYKTNLSITTNAYLGPNSYMTSGTLTTFNINGYFSNTAAASSATISDLNTAYGSATATNKATLQFTYQGDLVTLTSNSFTAGGILSSTYASTLNSNGSLNSAGTIPNLEMGGATVATASSASYYNIYCYTGSTYLWGSQNINVTEQSLTLMSSLGKFLDSSYKTNYSISTNGYLGPNSAMTGGKNTTFSINLYASTTSASTTTIGSMATNYGTSGFK